jgi:hypothetical protein
VRIVPRDELGRLPARWRSPGAYTCRVSGSGRPATRDQTRRDFLWSAGLVACSVAVCVMSALVGRWERGDVTYYVLALEGSGHPGVVGASTSIGLSAVAVAAALASVAVPSSQRRLWVAGSCLFAALAIVQITGVHDLVPGVDLLLRPLLWVLLVIFVRHVRRTMSFGSGGAWMVAGVVLLAVSELIDLYPSGDDLSFRYHDWTSVLEESTLSVGAWSIAAGALGTAVVLIRRAADGGASGDVSAGPAPLERQPEG